MSFDTGVSACYTYFALLFTLNRFDSPDNRNEYNFM
jgi:hypothetical protein